MQIFSDITYKTYNFFLSIIKKFFLEINFKYNLSRPGSKPFFSPDTFRGYADYVFENLSKPLNNFNVNLNDVIYVDTNGNNLEYFFDYIHPNIQNKYILISHNSAKIIDEEIAKFQDSKIIHWFAENLTIPNNKKISILPIGLESRYKLKNGTLYEIKKISKKSEIQKERLILCSFATQTNKEVRQYVYDIAEVSNLCDINIYKNRKDYIESLSKYMFNLCPEGIGLDTHRFWETLIAKTIPIVKNNNLIDNLSKYDIPMLVLDSWDDLENLSEKWLIEFYLKNKDILIKSDYTYFEFWKDKIESKFVQNNVFNQ